ncbi:hypothetical protein [Burkholderia oklahomensis]|uniref:hypothetical protein n=1 Tax=Burkholderia oklahomensis TaxID=342113 RepID=UPI0002FBF3EC|nr:hypothetical protein [Burkholderia oklahomensis]MBI0362969.1 hypothetical protein [Burkholderia oklahomensis]
MDGRGGEGAGAPVGGAFGFRCVHAAFVSLSRHHGDRAARRGAFGAERKRSAVRHMIVMRVTTDMTVV